MKQRIALVGERGFHGTGVLVEALVAYLGEKGCEVSVLEPEPPRTRGPLRARTSALARRVGLANRGDPWLRSLERKLARGRFDILMVVAQPQVFEITIPERTRTFYFCQAPWAHEQREKDRRRARADAEERFARNLERERRIFARADHVLVAWNTYEAFLRANVYDGSNFVPHPLFGWYGCTPGAQRAQFATPPSIVHVGDLLPYWVNLPMLTRVASRLNARLDFYGPTPADSVPPEISFHGLATDLEATLLRYQLGLNCVTDEPLRRHAFSSKVLLYLSAGLPVLSPEWQELSHQLAGVVSYTEGSLPAVIARAGEPSFWKQLADAAYDQAQALSWDRVLAPLDELL